MISTEQITNVLSIIKCRTLVNKNITILKEEKDGSDEIINSVRYISFNAWIRRQVSSIAKVSNCKIWLIFEIIYYYYDYLTKILDLFSYTDIIVFKSTIYCILRDFSS